MTKHIGFIFYFFLFSLTAFGAKPNVKNLAEIDSVRKAAVVHRHAIADSIRKNVVTRVFFTRIRRQPY